MISELLIRVQDSIYRQPGLTAADSAYMLWVVIVIVRNRMLMVLKWINWVMWGSMLQLKVRFSHLYTSYLACTE